MSTHQKLSIPFIFVGILLMGAGSTVLGQIPKGNGDPTVAGSIHGTVYLPSGHPVDSRIKIKLTSINNAGIDLYTDLNGQFQYDDLAPGNYTIDAAQEDASQGSASEQVTVHAGQHLTLMIYLKKPEDATKRKPGSSTIDAEKPVPPKAKQEYGTAVNLASIGQLDGAIVHFKNAIEIFPDYLDARNDLGVVYLKLNRRDDAAEQFQSAIRISPKSYNPRLNLAIILLGKRQYSEAADQLNQCVSIDSSQPSGHLYLGNALLGQSDYTGAKRELSTALDIGGAKFSVAHYYLSYVYLKTGDKEQAVHELETFLGSQTNEERMVTEAQNLLQRLKGQ
ncbi:MAG TPA: tetratricopeptide repeat protein [Blastocatellia bacterium]